MAEHKRRKRAAPAADIPVESAATSLSPDMLRLGVVTLAIVCYVAMFYATSSWRKEVLALVLVPDAVARSWTSNGELELGFFDRLPLIALALGIVGIAWSSGSLIVRGWGLDRRLGRLETELFSAGVGLSLWSTWTLLVGLFGLLGHTWLVWLPAVVSASLAGFQMAARRAAEVTTPRVPRNKQDWLWPSMLALGIPFVIFYLLAAVLPPRPMLEFDVTEYHLQVPKEWFQAGRITFLPHNVYGNMPLGAEMFALLASTLMPGELGWWYGALVGKVVMASATILTSLLLFAAGRRIGSNTAGVVSALVYLSTPWIYLVSVSGRNEGVLAFYLALAVYAVWLWLRETHEEDASALTKSHLLKIAGFFAGSAAAVKYTGVLFVVLPLAVAVGLGYYLEQRDRRESKQHPILNLKAILLFSIGAFAACGLWYVKNIALTGNPVYPMAAGIFGGESRTPQKSQQFAQAHAAPPFTADEIGNELQRFFLSSEWLSPLLVPLAALAVLIKSERRTALWLAIFLAFFMLCWFCFTHRLDRFWTPALVIVAWLAGLGATWTAERPWRHVLVTVLFWGLVSNFLVISSGWYVAGAEDKLPENRVLVSLDALRSDLLLPEHRYLNEHVPRGYQTLLVGDAQPFDLTVPALYNTCFDDVVFDELIKDKDRDQRFAALSQRKVAYIVIDWSEIERYRNSYGFDSIITPKLVNDELVKHQKLLKKVAAKGPEGRRVEVFEVLGVVPRPEEDSSMPKQKPIEELINDVEAELGYKLPREYSAFLKKHNTLQLRPGKPIKPKHAIDLDVDLIGVTMFGVGEGPNTVLQEQEAYDFYERVPQHIVCIGEASYRLRLCLSLGGKDRGKVYVWVPLEDWVENPKPSYEGLHLAFDSFDELLVQLP